MIQTVLRNLISNSIKFTPQGGKIIISAKKQEGNGIISVKDNGVGMKPEKLKELENQLIVESNQGTEGEIGTGFGFKLVKDFVEKNDGQLEVKSGLNQGTEVILKFKLYSSQPSDNHR